MNLLFVFFDSMPKGKASLLGNPEDRDVDAHIVIESPEREPFTLILDFYVGSGSGSRLIACKNVIFIVFCLCAGGVTWAC